MNVWLEPTDSWCGQCVRQRRMDVEGCWLSSAVNLQKVLCLLEQSVLSSARAITLQNDVNLHEHLRVAPPCELVLTLGL